MAKVLKIALLILLLTSLWEGAGDASAVCGSAQEAATELVQAPTSSSANHCLQEGKHYYSAATQYAHWLYAEQGNSSGQVNLQTLPRWQRIPAGQKEAFLPACGTIELLRRQTGRASLGQDRPGYAHPLPFSAFACDYYIFALRRILI
jgi:hypothetical protein